MTFPHLKVSYFPGQGEPIRMALVIAGIPFDDDRVQRDTWSTIEKTFPFRQVPALAIDGHVFGESSAILRYVGALGGLYPTTNLVDALRVDEICSYKVELVDHLIPSFKESDPEKKKAMREALLPDLRDMLGLLEARLAAGSSTPKGPWFLDTVSIADLLVYEAVLTFRVGFVDHIPTDICDGFPRMMAIFHAVQSHPKVVAWYAAQE
ncbi:Aste57867_687 [Aphanomyces stellatus]|uniref:Aste57867_687 protein n=1 Tax=Aphanomyces stellatus TaxID=120398 RepID=A0A485K3L8_9STRA|nr:hypothetical protein As57867_000686 [Aphanomyces stellatus]VFT77912.1 Aste57867_687 [Aphanomyces stellatus]